MNFEEIDNKVGNLTDLLNDYQRLGTPEEILHALDLAEKLITKYQRLGSPEEIEKVFDTAEGMLRDWHPEIPLKTPEIPLREYKRKLRIEGE